MIFFLGDYSSQNDRSGNVRQWTVDCFFVSIRLLVLNHKMWMVCEWCVNLVWSKIEYDWLQLALRPYRLVSLGQRFEPLATGLAEDGSSLGLLDEWWFWGEGARHFLGLFDKTLVRHVSAGWSGFIQRTQRNVRDQLRISFRRGWLIGSWGNRRIEVWLFGRLTSRKLGSLWIHIVHSEKGLGKASNEFHGTWRRRNGRLLSHRREFSWWHEVVQWSHWLFSGRSRRRFRSVGGSCGFCKRKEIVHHLVGTLALVVTVAVHIPCISCSRRWKYISLDGYSDWSRAQARGILPKILLYTLFCLVWGNIQRPIAVWIPVGRVVGRLASGNSWYWRKRIEGGSAVADFGWVIGSIHLPTSCGMVASRMQTVTSQLQGCTLLLGGHSSIIIDNLDFSSVVLEQFRHEQAERCHDCWIKFFVSLKCCGNFIPSLNFVVQKNRFTIEWDSFWRQNKETIVPTHIYHLQWTPFVALL